MTTSSLITDLGDHVLTITLNRPDAANALLVDIRQVTGSHVTPLDEVIGYLGKLKSSPKKISRL